MPRSRTLRLATIAGALVLAGASVGSAAILPESAAGLPKSASRDLPLGDAELGQELGFESSEVAEYGSGARSFTVSAWRFKDALSAYSFQQAQQGRSTSMIRRANYVLDFAAAANLKPDQRDAFLTSLKKTVDGPVPELIALMPKKEAVAGSERYITGPIALQRFLPRVPPGMAGFHYSAEAQMARYVDGSTLVIVEYPLPSMARERVEEFRKLPGATVKRTGSRAVIVFDAPSEEASARLLNPITYEGQITKNVAVPGQELKDMAHGIVTMILLALLIGGFCVVGGLLVGVYLVYRHRQGFQQADPAMISLDLAGD